MVKKFVLKALLLVTIIIAIVVIALLLPPTPAAKNSLLFAQIKKDSILLNTPGPRIIFIGGSNLSFGLNSKMIKDSLNFNPINTGLTAGLGLKYMLRNTLRYIRTNDVVVIAPEYHQFYGNELNGTTELLSMIFDISPDTKNMVDVTQYPSLLKYLPRYTASKLNPLGYLARIDTAQIAIYDRKSFNNYGDVYVHWLLRKVPVSSYPVTGSLNQGTLEALNEFRTSLAKKQVKLFVTFPCYQDRSFDRSIPEIKAIESLLNKNSYTLLGTPERYRFADSLLFNSPYHLTGKGVQLRTNFLIADIKKALSKK